MVNLLRVAHRYFGAWLIVLAPWVLLVEQPTNLDSATCVFCGVVFGPGDIQIGDKSGQQFTHALCYNLAQEACYE